MKKKYSLALWGGAARWLTHIWVLKYIEENGIEISEVAWTSIWAIIGAFIALWKTSNEIFEIVKNLNFLKLVDLDLKNWVVSWQKIYKKLEDIFWKELIENTKIPLKIISTDIDTWEKVVFVKWKIIDAIRASISLPMVFKYYELWKSRFLDWWLKSNLPICDLDWIDIIAVSAIRDKAKKIESSLKFWPFEFKKWFLGNNYEILKKTITIMMSTNEDLTLEIAKRDWKNVILLVPDVTWYEYYDFNKIDELFKAWYDEAILKLKNI